jgi:hypothetical protein
MSIIPFSVFLFCFSFSPFFSFSPCFFLFPFSLSFFSPSLTEAARARPRGSATRPPPRPQLVSTPHAFAASLLRPSQRRAAPPSLCRRRSSRRPFFLTVPLLPPAPMPPAPRTPLPCGCSDNLRPSVRWRPPPAPSVGVHIPRPSRCPLPAPPHSDLFVPEWGKSGTLATCVETEQGAGSFHSACRQKRSKE